MSAALGKQFHIGEHERSDLTQAYQDTLASWDLFLTMVWFFDPDVIYNGIEYRFWTRLQDYISRSLSILLSGLDVMSVALLTKQ